MDSSTGDVEKRDEEDVLFKAQIGDQALAQAIAIGEQQIHTGHTISHEDAKKRLSKWIR
jgi:hypothetical protein